MGIEQDFKEFNKVRTAFYYFFSTALSEADPEITIDLLKKFTPHIINLLNEEFNSLELKNVSNTLQSYISIENTILSKVIRTEYNDFEADETINLLEHTINPHAQMNSKAFYRALKVLYNNCYFENESTKRPDDHLVTMLLFMYHIVKEGYLALNSNDYNTYNHYIETQSGFYRMHLNNWIKQLKENIIYLEKYDNIYPAILVLLCFYLEYDKNFIESTNLSSTL